MPPRRTHEDVVKQINETFNGEYMLVSKYTRMVDPIEIKHNVCGHVYPSARAKDFINENKNRCPQCREKSFVRKPNNRINEEEMLKRFKKILGSEYQYLGGYTRMKSEIKVKHSICGHIFDVTPHMLLGVKQTRCPECADSRRGIRATDSYLDDMLVEGYEWLEAYKGNNKIKHKILHHECNLSYDVRPNDFQQGYRCPSCSVNESQEENEFYEYIRSILDPEVKIYRNYRRFTGKEIDVYIPSLKIGFEYNGHYWHSDRFKDKNYHLDKLNGFNEKGIDIYFISSVDWNNKKPIVKSLIRSKLNLSPNNIYARKTTVDKNITTAEERQFLNDNHIQGYVASKIKVGLRDDHGELLALITFTDARKSLNNNSNKLELLRFAVRQNHSVVGGFSRLLKHGLDIIRESTDYKEIFTFADREISKGNVYLLNGFELSHITKPSYRYVKNNKYINRFTLRKSELKKKYPQYYKEEMTELEIADMVPNLYRIWNCGNYCFKYKVY